HPQVDNWQNFQVLQWRQAFAITPPGGKSIPCAATFQGNTAADINEHTVVVTNIKVTNTYFPGVDPDTAAKLKPLLLGLIPPSVTVSLDLIVASTPKPTTAPGVQLNNTPPVIFVSSSPAILLGVEGQPVFAAVHDTKLEYLVNSSWH